MNVAKVEHGGHHRLLRVLATAAALVAVPLSASAQVPTPAGDLTVPTTLPPVHVLRDVPETDTGSGGPTSSTTTPPTTTPTTVVPPTTEQSRTSPDGSTGSQPSDDAPVSSSRRSSSRRSASTPGRAAETNLVERAAVDVPAPPAISRLRRVTVPAARQFGFPLGLAVLVLAFLTVQSRLDARDPKLAAAPVTVDDDLLGFS